MLVLAAAGTYLFPAVADHGASQHVNAVLRELETAARANPTLTAEIKKFTSHSSRSGGATEANEHDETQAQWVGPRGGWDLGSLQTMFEYIYGTTKTDGKVGRALSGWKHVSKGGFCPTIACIDVASRDEFALYAAELMSAVELEQHIKYSLSCVLLLHFDAVRAANPQHQLIVRLVSCRNTGLSRVQFWAAQVRGDFERRNGSSLPDENGGVTVMAADMVEMTQAMRDYESEVIGLRSEVAAMKQELQSTHLQLQRLVAATELLVARQTVSLGQEMNSQTLTPASSGPSTAPANITRHFQRIMPPSVTPSSILFPQSLVISMKSLTMSCAFHKWYTEELFKCTLRNEKERKVRGKIARAVFLMKRFLPAGTVIQPKPDTLEQFQEWSSQIRAYGEQAQEQALKLCYKAYNRELQSGLKKRRRELQVMLEGMTRRLGDIATNDKLLWSEVTGSAEDLANPNETEPDLSDMS